MLRRNLRKKMNNKPHMPNAASFKAQLIDLKKKVASTTKNGIYQNPSQPEQKATPTRAMIFQQGFSMNIGIKRDTEHSNDGSRKIGTPVTNPLWSQIKVDEARTRVENVNAKAGIEGLAHKD